MPPGLAPIIIADAGFKVPFYREVQAPGWRWVGRVRGRDFVRLKSRWSSCKTLFARATATPTALGEGEWVRSNPLRAVFALVRRAPKGRRGKTAFGRRARSKASTHNARSAKEPWLPGASTRFAAWPAKRLVRLYAQRMQIEIYQTWCLHKSLRQGRRRDRRSRRGHAVPSGGGRCAGHAGARPRRRRPESTIGGDRPARPGEPAARLYTAS